MFDRLKRLSWGWGIVALAYGIGALPIEVSQRFFWAGLATAAAYCVLALRTTRKTIEVAQEYEGTPLWNVWRVASRATLTNMVILIPLFYLLAIAAAWLTYTMPTQCPGLFRAYCLSYGPVFRWDYCLLALLVGTVFCVLDHGLLVALTLLCRRYLVQSDGFISKTALGLRFALACAVLSVVAVSVGILEYRVQWHAYYDPYNPDPVSITEKRVYETIYPAFEPLVTNGVFLSANILKSVDGCMYPHNTYLECSQVAYSWRFILRQMVVAMLGAMMYLLLIAGVLRLARPERIGHEKAKRG